MSRVQLAVVTAFLTVVLLILSQMSTATVAIKDVAVEQTIAKPFCATSQDDLELDAVSVVKQGSSVAASWRFRDPMPSALVLKVDLSSTDLKYHWLVAAEIRNGQVSRIQTLDTVSKQLVGFTEDDGSAKARIIGDQVVVTAPLPGAPDEFAWFAAAGPPQADVRSLAEAQYSAFCPAGWLAQYPPSDPPSA